MANPIRSMHDAIDLLVSREVGTIQAKERQETEKMRLAVESKLGVDKMRSEYMRLFGSEMHVNNYGNNDSLYHSTLEKTVSPVRAKYAEVVCKIRLMAEDAHVKIVTGDKGAILDELRKELSKVSVLK